MLKHINRDIVILFPKQPLIDWVNRIFPESKEECPKFFEHDEGTTYLLPENYSIDDALDNLKANFRFFFEEELFQWCVDETYWPKNLTWQLFENWFHYSIQTMVFDVGDEEIIRED